VTAHTRPSLCVCLCAHSVLFPCPVIAVLVTRDSWLVLVLVQVRVCRTNTALHHCERPSAVARGGSASLGARFEALFARVLEISVALLVIAHALVVVGTQLVLCS
jgi:hypothetical protein